MRIIAHKTLVQFYLEHSEAKTAIEHWYKKCLKAEWNQFSDIKNTFRATDAIGNRRYVFNIHGNDYRLVAMVLFKLKRVYIRFIGTHQAYEKIEDISNI